MNGCFKKVLLQTIYLRNRCRERFKSRKGGREGVGNV